MFFDPVYKSLRKVIPQGAYRSLSWSLGRSGAYHRPQTYLDIHRFYVGRGLGFSGKRVLEVGPGSQLFTAFLALKAGAVEVLVADPKVRPESLKAQRAAFEAFSPGSLGPDAESRVRCYKDISEVPATFDGAIDLICFHQVLEHLPDLPSFYRHNARLLARDGESAHLVDLTDHSYHVFGKFPFLRNFAGGRSLYHYRYSDRTFRILNDPKCYMNRRPLPAHLEAVRESGLRVRELAKTPFGKIPVHADLRRGLESYPEEDFRVANFFIRVAR